MKNVVECKREFFAYFNALLTRGVMPSRSLRVNWQGQQYCIEKTRSNVYHFEVFTKILRTYGRSFYVNLRDIAQYLSKVAIHHNA